MMPAVRLIDDRAKPLIDPCFRWTAAELRGAVLEALDLPRAHPDTAPPQSDGGFEKPG